MSLIKKSLLAAAAVTAFAVPGAQAAVGDKLTYKFNAESEGNAVASDPPQAILELTETASGVDFNLMPNWADTTGNFVKEIQFAYSGDTMTFVAGLGPQATTVTFETGSIDSGYSTTELVHMGWPEGNDKFDSSYPSSTWSFTGAGITLEDFMIYATATSTKPTPGFGVISLPGASPSNWVAQGPGELVPSIPEPETYALMAAGLALVAFTARRRQRQQA